MPRAARVGFGIGPFGGTQPPIAALGPGWGWGDWAEIPLWNYIPEIYKTLDAQRPNQELRIWTDAIKPHHQQLREAIQTFFDLRDPSRVPLAQLPLLAGDIGLADDQSQDENRRRAAVYDAFLLYLNKGTAKGYAIIGAFSNVIVTVDGLYEDPCGSNVYTLVPPDNFGLSFDEIPADTTSLFDDVFTVGGEIVLPLRFSASSQIVLLSVDSVTLPELNPDPIFTATVNQIVFQLQFTTSTTPGLISIDSVAHNGNPLAAGIDYTTNLGAGTVQLIQSYLVNARAMSAQTVFPLNVSTTTTPQLLSVNSVSKNGVPLVFGVGYTVSLAAGTVTLTASATLGDLLQINVTTTNPAAVGDTVQINTTLSPVTFTPNLIAGTIALGGPAITRGQYRITMTVNMPTDVFTNSEFGLWPLVESPVPYSITDRFFTAAGGETSFALPYNALTNLVLVAVTNVGKNNVPLTTPADYTVDLPNGTLNLTAPAAPGDVYRVILTVSTTVTFAATDGVNFGFQTVGGETVLTLPYSELTTPRLLSIDLVARDGVDLTLGTDYAVNLLTGAVTLTTAATAGHQYVVSTHLATLTLPFRGTTDPQLLSVLSVTRNALFTPSTTILPQGKVILTGITSSAGPFVVTVTVDGKAIRCRTNRLRLHLTRVPNALSVLPQGTAQILAKIATFKPAHVVFDSYTYQVTVPGSFIPKGNDHITTTP